MKTYNIKLTITDDQQEFLQKLAKRDGIYVVEELQLLCLLQLREEMELKEGQI